MTGARQAIVVSRLQAGSDFSYRLKTHIARFNMPMAGTTATALSLTKSAHGHS